MSADVLIQFILNGASAEALAEPRVSLADLLRDILGLTGTHLGCEQGVCGACTVLLDGRSVRSCLVLGVQVTGHEVTTIEGLQRVPLLESLVGAMSESHGLQCGFCTPGFLVSALEYLQSDNEVTEDNVRTAISGNICRCTGYEGIIQAILKVARTRREALKWEKAKDERR